MYVIYAVSGHEDDVIRQLGKIGYTAYAPKRILKQHENRIVRYSKRQHKATVELTLYGKPHRIICGIDIEVPDKKHKETALVDSLPALCRNVDT